MSSQAAEISKWKSRAIKLKAKTNPEMDKPGSPCTPTKRGHCGTTEPSHLLSPPKRFLLTPRKVDSPKRSLLESPKSRFFDVGETSEFLSGTCPKQFFDNSQLGTTQGEFSSSLCRLQVLMCRSFKTGLCSAEVSQVPDQDSKGNCAVDVSGSPA